MWVGAQGLLTFYGPTQSDLGDKSPGLGRDKHRQRKQRKEHDLGEKGPLN